jgi:hypothetical protein
LLQRLAGNRERYWEITRHQPLIHDIIAVAAAVDEVVLGRVHRPSTGQRLLTWLKIADLERP